MSQNSYKDLIAAKAMELVAMIYDVTEEFPRSGLINFLKEREGTQDSRLGTKDER